MRTRAPNRYSQPEGAWHREEKTLQQLIESRERSNPKTPRARDLWLLSGCLVTSEFAYLAMALLNAVNGSWPVFAFLGLMTLLFVVYALAYRAANGVLRRGRGRLLIIAAGAILFRLTLLPAGLTTLQAGPGLNSVVAGLRSDLRGASVVYDRFQLFDDDLWRYLWDGHVWSHGVNPYRYSPADPEVDPLADDEGTLTDNRAVWGDIRDNINYSAIPTPYPPFAQVVFRFSHWLAPGSVLVMKALFVSFDLTAALFIASALRCLGRPIELVLLYAWNPLVIKVFAGSGHMDSMLVASLAALTFFIMRRRHHLAAVSFGLAVLSKLSPLLLVPFVVRRIGLKSSVFAGALIVAGCLPFLGAARQIPEGLVTFGRTWQFNAGPFAVLQWFAGKFCNDPSLIARMVSGLAVLVVVVWLARRDTGQAEGFPNFGVAALGALIILGPTVMPWYVTWLLPLAVLAGERPWVYFSALVCLSFLVMVGQKEQPWTSVVEYSLLGVIFWIDWYRRRGCCWRGANGTRSPRSGER